MFYTQWVMSDLDVPNEGFRLIASYQGAAAPVVGTAVFGANPSHSVTATQPNTGEVFRTVSQGTNSADLLGRGQIDFFGPVDTVRAEKFGNPGGLAGFQMGGGCAALGSSKQVLESPAWDPDTQSFGVTYEIKVRSNRMREESQLR